MHTLNDVEQSNIAASKYLFQVFILEKPEVISALCPWTPYY